MTSDWEGRIKDARAGDADALTALLKEFGPRIESSVRIDPKWRSVLDVEDVMQVTYLEAFLQIKQLNASTVASFVAWLRTIGENNVRSAVAGLNSSKRPDPARRVTPRNADESMLALLEAVAVATTTPSRKVARKEASKWLNEAVRRLPESYRQVVTQYDLEGRTAQEVAKALGKSKGAVFMLRARAHTRLKDLLGPVSRYLSSSS